MKSATMLTIIALTLWQTGIVLNQFRFSRIRSVLRYFPLNIFPQWSVFLGPMTHLSLFYRDEQSNGSFSEWMEIKTIPSRSTLRSLIWNPHWQGTMTLRSLVIRVVRYSEIDPEIANARLENDRYFQVLRQFVDQFPPGAHSTRRQIRIDRGFGYFSGKATESPAFISEPYSL